MNATCVECGSGFHTRQPRLAKYCSQACKWLARKARDGIPCEVCGDPTGWTRRSGKEVVTHKACGRFPCGTATSYKKRACRCDLCRSAWATYNAKYGHARRATLRTLQPSEPIDPTAIYERDGWVCGICDLPVDPAEKFPSPGTPTLDHIVPISRGGLHVSTNLQCAHFYCNAVKGNRVEEAC